MACPNCGCKVHYQFNDADFGPDDERLERCAACGAVFDIEDAADDEDDEHPAADALTWSGFGPDANRALGDGLQRAAATTKQEEGGAGGGGCTTEQECEWQPWCRIHANCRRKVEADRTAKHASKPSGDGSVR